MVNKFSDSICRFFHCRYKTVLYKNILNYIRLILLVKTPVCLFWPQLCQLYHQLKKVSGLKRTGFQFTVCYNISLLTLLHLSHTTISLLVVTIGIALSYQLVHELRERVYLFRERSSVSQVPPNFLKELSGKSLSQYPNVRTENGRLVEIYDPNSGVKTMEYVKKDQVHTHVHLCAISTK